MAAGLVELADSSRPRVPMIEAGATHITTRLTEPLLVCELYPGVLVVDTYSGPFTVLEYADRVEALPAGQERTFPITERTAELAAALYEEKAYWASAAEARCGRRSSGPDVPEGQIGPEPREQPQTVGE